MKKHLLVAAVVFTAVSAQASKARLDALGNSEHIVDIQEVFTQEPDQALNYEAATVEFGGNGVATTQAEGGFIRKMGDSAWSLYLGRSSTTYQDFVDGIADGVADAVAASAGDSLKLGHVQSNPLQLTYASKAGDINWGTGLFYVGNDYKNSQDFGDYDAKVKQTVAGLLVGANNGVWDAQARIGLIGETKSSDIANATAALIAGGLTNGSTLKVNSTSSIKLSGGYLMDTMYFYGGYEMGSGEAKVGATKLADVTKSTITVGVVNSHKKDGVDFFYGASAVIVAEEDKGVIAASKEDTTTVPLIVGVEADVTDWLVLRGSLTQNFGLLSTSKARGGSATSASDSTDTALGAGFKWGKAMIDTVVKTGNDGNFGTNGNNGDIFGQASVTYNF